MKENNFLNSDKIYLFHNNRCSKSREVKKYLDDNNIIYEVIDYLNKENDYTDFQMKSTKDFQKNLFNELKSRIKEEDESVPYFYNEYYYWKKFEKGFEHPVYLRKSKNNDSKEEILLDVNEMSKAYDFFNIGD